MIMFRLEVKSEEFYDKLDSFEDVHESRQAVRSLFVC